MKADIVLVKRNEATNAIADIIIIENKLSSGTSYTPRQKEGWKKLANGQGLNTKYRVEGETDDLFLGENTIFTHSKIKSYKISDHGSSDISKVDIAEIPVSNFKNYEYKPRNN